MVRRRAAWARGIVCLVAVAAVTSGGGVSARVPAVRASATTAGTLTAAVARLDGWAKVPDNAGPPEPISTTLQLMTGPGGEVGPFPLLGGGILLSNHLLVGVQQANNPYDEDLQHAITAWTLRGVRVWSDPIGAPHLASPAVLVGDKIALIEYAGQATNGTGTALDPHVVVLSLSGAQMARVPVVRAALAPNDDIVSLQGIPTGLLLTVGTPGPASFCEIELLRLSGAVDWQHAMPDCGAQPPVVSQGVAVWRGIGNAPDTLTGWSLSTGKRLWTKVRTPRSWIQCVAGGYVLVQHADPGTSARTTVEAIDATTGAVAWHTTAGDAIVADRTQFVSIETPETPPQATSSILDVYSLRTGRVEATVPLGAGPETPLAMSGHYVLVGGSFSERRDLNVRSWVIGINGTRYRREYQRASDVMGSTFDLPGQAWTFGGYGTWWQWGPHP